MSGKAVRETLAALGVIASMVFVGMEIRQNNAIARGQTRQALADRSFDIFMSQATDDSLAYLVAALRTWSAEDPPDCDGDNARECAHVRAVLRHHENVFIQVRDGVADPSVFGSYGFTSGPHYRTGWFRQLWPTWRVAYDPDFVVAFEAEYDLAP